MDFTAPKQPLAVRAQRCLTAFAGGVRKKIAVGPQRRIRRRLSSGRGVLVALTRWGGLGSQRQ